MRREGDCKYLWPYLMHTTGLLLSGESQGLLTIDIPLFHT